MDSQIAAAELRTDIERAMKALKPNELQIIRMKYYEGMSVREIADSLELPYETVKKRHKRSVMKLGRNMMFVLALLFIFSACAYGILRYFDIIPPIGSWPWPWTWEEKEEPEEEPQDDTETGKVRPLRIGEPEEEDMSVDSDSGEELTGETFEPYLPDLTENLQRPEDEERVSTVMEEYTVSPGYGINVDPKEPVYSLARKKSVENEEYTLTLEEVSYINHTLTATVKLIVKKETLRDWKENYRMMRIESFTFQEKIWRYQMSIGREMDEHTLLQVFRFDNVIFPNVKEGIKDLSILFNTGESIGFDMESVEQKKVTGYPYQVGEYGGILAIPRLEDGTLVIAVYPLDDGDEFQIVPAIVAETGSPEILEGMTVTGEDGTTFTGECIRYRPWGQETYFEWDFGKAKPGNYTLNIPWVNLKASLNEKLSIPLNLTDNSWEDMVYEIPRGEVWIKECTPLDVKPDNWPDYYWTDVPSTMGHWRIRLGYACEDPLCPVTGFYGFKCKMELYPREPAYDSEEEIETPEYDFRLLSIDTETQTMEFMLKADLKRANPEKTNIYMNKNDIVGYRWNESFEIPLAVEGMK